MNVQSIIENWDEMRLHDWYKVEMVRLSKCVPETIYFGTIDDCISVARDAIAAYQVGPYGNLCEPGTFADEPFYRINSMSPEEAYTRFSKLVESGDQS